MNEEYPTITKDNLETWNMIVYGYIIQGMLKNTNLSYGEAMGKAEKLTNYLFRGLKLQELVKERIKNIPGCWSEECMGCEYDYRRSTLQSLLEESEKN